MLTHSYTHIQEGALPPTPRLFVSLPLSSSLFVSLRLSPPLFPACSGLLPHLIMNGGKEEFQGGCGVWECDSGEKVPHILPCVIQFTAAYEGVDKLACIGEEG